ncbi:MAG TPA: YifB family Mg chelatase-like AAA ATPase [Rectinemataceae bacterium]
MRIFAFESLGMRGSLVEVEVDIRRGIPAVDIVGLASASVKEARERVRAAIRNAGFEFPQDRLLINLSPSDLPKEGSRYDLPIALRILVSSGCLPDCQNDILALGELTLQGGINPVRGALPAALESGRLGIRIAILPDSTARECSGIEGLSIYPARHLEDLARLLGFIREGRSWTIGGEDAPLASRVIQEAEHAGEEDARNREAPLPDFSDYWGNPDLVRALCIAAAGRHNLLLFGPPGTGKTMAVTRLPSLLPALEEDSAREVAALWSLRGWTFPWKEGAVRPPFRSPHHSASLEGMVGGGKPPVPGEVSLAHTGLLFLDETPEFRRDVLQSLREPLEREAVSIVRAGRSLSYPADFQLALAANSCPCGYLGSSTRPCLCSPQEIQRYWKKLGGPLLDRIDLRIPVKAPDLASFRVSPPSQEGLANAVLRARDAQRNRARFVETEEGTSLGRGALTNGKLGPREIAAFCDPGNAGRLLLRESFERRGLSARACHSLLRMARTIADMEGRKDMRCEDMEEALSLRIYGEGDAFWPA